MCTSSIADNVIGSILIQISSQDCIHIFFSKHLIITETAGVQGIAVQPYQAAACTHISLFPVCSQAARTTFLEQRGCCNWELEKLISNAKPYFGQTCCASGLSFLVSSALSSRSVGLEWRPLFPLTCWLFPGLWSHESLTVTCFSMLTFCALNVESQQKSTPWHVAAVKSDPKHDQEM